MIGGHELKKMQVTPPYHVRGIRYIMRAITKAAGRSRGSRGRWYRFFGGSFSTFLDPLLPEALQADDRKCDCDDASKPSEVAKSSTGPELPGFSMTA